jgi:hypothetical protein
MKDKINECLSPKLDELKAIFDKNESSMEWEKIVDEFAKEEMIACGVQQSPSKVFLTKALGDFSDCMRYRVQEKIIKRLEDHELIKKYTVLNKEV